MGENKSNETLLCIHDVTVLSAGFFHCCLKSQLNIILSQTLTNTDMKVILYQLEALHFKNNQTRKK